MIGKGNPVKVEFSGYHLTVHQCGVTGFGAVKFTAMYRSVRRQKGAKEQEKRKYNSTF